MATTSTDLYALSPQQKRLWTEDGTSAVPYVQIACLVEGELDPPRLRDAIARVVGRHEALRTRLVPVSGLTYPLQEVAGEALWHDVRGTALTQQDVHVDLASVDLGALLERDRIVGAWTDDLALRVALIPVDRSKHLLIVSAPGMAADAVTLQQVIREVADAYGTPDAFTSDSDLLQYADYAAWRDGITTDDDELRKEGLAYWRRERAATSDHAGLAERASRGTAGSTFETVAVRLDAATTHALAALAEPDAKSLDTVMLTCWATLLHRLTGAPEIGIDVVLEGRPYEEMRRGMGPYAQAVPVRSSWMPGVSVSAFLQQMARRVEDASLWQNYYEEDSHRTPHLRPFGYAFGEQPDPMRPADLVFTICAQRVRTYRAELLLDCRHDRQGLAVSLIYATSAFDRPYVALLARRFEVLCRSIAAGDSGQAVARLRVLTDEDERQLLTGWNDTADASVPPRCTHEWFAEQAARMPSRPAVVCGGISVNYQELDARASRLAHRLRVAGVGPETTVAVFVGRSVEMVIALLAVWKAGGAYVPLETTGPVTDRIRHILDESKATALLTHSSLRPAIDSGTMPVVCVDDPDLCDEEPHPIGRSAGTGNLAYIIFTSGSTGRPKGVTVAHRSLSNLWQALRREIYGARVDEPLSVTLNAPISFDASVKQLLALLNGHTLHVIPDEVRSNPHEFVAYLRDHRIDVLDCTPSHLSTLIEAGLLETEQGPSMALIGGEPIDASLWSTLAGSRRMAFFNVYGPTECTVDSTAIRVRADRGPSIGSPLLNVQVHVLDPSLQLQPPGVVGELCIGGAGVARGYWGAPALTAERFVPNPFAAVPGERLYRTGDLVTRLADGTLAYIGRKDHQTKVRGFRVELGEISSTLREHPSVREAAVKAVRDADDTRLAAYVVSANGPSATADDLRAFLAARLPEYMVPHWYHWMDALPVTANGKLDLTALPAPASTAPAMPSGGDPPRTDVEVALALIWSSILGLETIGIRQNFFHLGGHSLLAMKMIARVRKQFATDISLPRLFQLPTIEALADAIERRAGDGRAHASAISPRPR